MYIACEDYVEACEWNASEPSITLPPTFRRFVDGGETCRRLGIEQKWLDPLLEKGKLVTIHDPIKSRLLIDGQSIKLKPLSGPTVDGLPEWRFDRREVADLIDRLEGAMAGHSTAVRDTPMAVRAAIRQMKTHGYSPSRCLRAILEGEIVAQIGLMPFPHYPYCQT